jgi:hypothetical protein
MTRWQWLTKRILLEDERDIMARVGVRFIWCTGPYFFLAIVFSTFGKTAMLSPWPAFFFLAIPFIGGIVDWYRLKGRTRM